MARHSSLLACVSAALILAAQWPSTALGQASPAQTDVPTSDNTLEELLKMPEGNFKELLTYFKQLQSFRPKDNVEATAYRMRAPGVLEKTAKELQSIATDDDKKLPEYTDVLAYVLSRDLNKLFASPEDQVRILNDAKQLLLAAEKFTPNVASVAQSIPSNFEFSGKPAEAAKTYAEFSTILLSKKDAQFRGLGEKLAGSARRMNLVGNPLELTGTLMDGKSFNWDSYRGKVVLVDFWATWCGPCIAEQPNVKANYEKYHDLGFDVVGVSLDHDRPALEKFLDKENLPWATIHDGDWSANKVAQYYGIMGIPTVLLVDKEGRVVDLNARGRKLGNQLERLLGPTEEAEVKQQ